MADYDEEGYEDEGSELDQLIEQQEMEMAMTAEEQQKRQVEERLTKNKLRRIFRNYSGGSKTTLNPIDQKIIKDAKKFPKLKNEVNRIYLLLANNKIKNVTKAMSSSPGMLYIVVGAFLVVIIAAAIIGFASIMPWMFPSEDGENITVSSVNGVKGTDFYGVRMLYKDDEKAKTAVVENYVEFVENGISALTETTSVTTDLGETYSVTITINLTLPEDEYFNSFNEENFKTDYSDLYNVVFEIAKLTYEKDNATAYAGSSLLECCGGIQMFGVADVAQTVTRITTLLQDKINIVAKDAGGNAVADVSLIKAELVEVLSQTYLAEPKYSVRVEKLFVKDYILNGDEMMSDITKENYVAMIFMPKKNVKFSDFEFSVGGGDLSNFNISMNNGVLLVGSLNFGTAENPSYVYSAGLLNVQAGVFADINTNDLDALANEMSLAEVANLDNSLTYLEEKTTNGANPITYLTLKQNGVVVSLNNDVPFFIVESGTKWQTN